MRLILVRHGETHWNKERRVQGFHDIELNEVGKKQAQSLALALKDESIDAIYTSPLKRALETAQAIEHFHSVTRCSEDGLKELNPGAIDGLTIETMRSEFGDFLKEWANDAAPLKFPGGGESLQEVQNRAWSAVQEMLRRHPDDVVVVVSHFFTLLSIICKAMDLHLSRFRVFRRLDIASLSVIDFDEWGITLVRFNDTGHLREEASWRLPLP